MSKTVILIEDESDMRRSLEQWLSLSGFSVTGFDHAGPALEQLDSSFPGVVISDVKMSGISGLDVLSTVVGMDDQLPVVLITGHGDVPMAVEAMKMSAYDFLEKPFSPEHLVETVERALEKRRLVLENRKLREQLATASGLSKYMIGESRAMCDLRADLVHLAGADVDVLIVGETGTGKELAARALHDFSARSEQSFHPVNCGAISKDLFESEFFGHAAGAFTGAQGARTGLIEHADKGTLFLDEITSMPPDMQVKLLRAVETGKIQRVGTNRLIDIDVRIVSAANEAIDIAIQEKRFRDDLYYRLGRVELRIPPLRQRREDIPVLFQHFVDLAERQFDRKARPVSKVDVAALHGHDWPGNVRELRNIAERFTLARTDGQADIGRLIDGGPGLTQPQQTLADQIADFERTIIARALAQHQGEMGAVMQDLGLPRRTLNDKMNRYGLSRPKAD